jgi:lipopolysaccharide biosynthesis regulator YciM
MPASSLIPEMGDTKALLEKIFDHVRQLPPSDKVDKIQADLADLGTKFLVCAGQVDRLENTVKVLWEHHLVNQQAFQDLLGLRNKIWAIGLATVLATLSGGAAIMSALKP